MPRTAIVTGAASGIGRATSLRLASDGMALALFDLDGGGLAATAAAAADAGAPKVTMHEIDLRSHDAIAGTVAAVLTDHGGIDLLVNNAGIGVAATVPDTELADWDAIIAVNLTATFQMCRAVLPAMIHTGSGVVVNVASVAGLVGVRNRGAYCASKAGVIGLTRAIAVDHAHQGIRANAICPGTVATEWIGKILADAPDPAAARAAMEARQLDGQMGSPEEVAAGIAFLASDDARFVNGSAFVMDGGMTAI